MTTDTHDKYSAQARTELVDVRARLVNARSDRDGSQKLVEGLERHEQELVSLLRQFGVEVPSS